MIDRIEGEVVEVGEDYVVIKANGISYRLLTSRTTKEAIGDRKFILLYTHLLVRENALELYGFCTPQEREIFRLLLPVGGVGPRVALQITSDLTPGGFLEAVISERIEALRAIKGVGKKTAERLILELKEKVAKIAPGEPVRIFSEQEEMAAAALTHLGFGERQSRQAIEKVKSKAQSVEELIKKALEILR
jgi:Holliday junction DNA helicase RuvA